MSCFAHTPAINIHFKIGSISTSKQDDRFIVSTEPTFHLCFNFPSLCLFSSPSPPSSGHRPNITLQPPRLSITSLSKPNQSKISLPLLFRPPEPNSNISTGTCKGNCPCGKISKPPIVVLLLLLSRDTATLCAVHIYLGVQICPLLYCVSNLEQPTVENVSVLRKGEYHNKNAATDLGQCFTTKVNHNHVHLDDRSKLG